jgi:hypothetical protein
MARGVRGKESQAGQHVDHGKPGQTLAVVAEGGDAF